jgi:guanylate kinase
VVSGPSGGGKTTVVARLLTCVPDLVRSVSVTTRVPRPGERDGRDYRFVSLREFAAMRRAGRFLECARVHGAWYGTPRAPVMDALRRGRDVVLSVDVQGARAIRRRLRRRAILVFLLPPSLRALRLRLTRRRTETAAAIRRRLEQARRELRCARDYEYRVTNDRLRDAVAELAAVVRACRRRARRVHDTAGA